MIDIKILRAMANAGAPVDAILAAIEVDQSAEIARVQARRAADADRKRRERKSKEVQGQSRTALDSLDAVGSYLLTSNLENSNIKQEDKKVRERRATKTLLPDSWEPKPSHYAKAARALVDRKAEDLRNWAKSKAIMRADWDATFHGFLRPREGMNGHEPSAKRSGIMEAIGQHIETIRGWDGRGSEPNGAEAVGLFPNGRRE